jgi:LysR family transcriptional regulator, glycine cleavage system transcriptional activator
VDDQLPPFGALRAFDAAARLGSFQLAAEELRLTPSAVSHQIRQLEDLLDTALFLRQHRKVSLTPSGETLREFSQRGFSELRNGIAAVRSTRNPRVLRVTAAPAFANAFLSHRLHTFERANPALDLQLVIAHSVMDLTADGLDIAIRLSADPPRRLWSEAIADLTYTPVCAAALAVDLCNVDDLAGATRIVVREFDQGWANWFSGLGYACIGREVHVETLNVAVQMALDGLGVALLPQAIVARHLSERRLVAPFQHTIVSKSRYWLACRRGEETSKKVQRFAHWLHGEMQSAGALPVARGAAPLPAPVQSASAE